VPLYDYECEKCGKTLELLTKRDPEQLFLCKEQATEPATPCEGILLRKTIQKGSGFLLKGGGWHSSDYKGVKH
jgi:putative FmdB family regulatory protein